MGRRDVSLGEVSVGRTSQSVVLVVVLGTVRVRVVIFNHFERWGAIERVSAIERVGVIESVSVLEGVSLIE